MTIERALDNILNTNSKINIIRLFVSKREDFIATGREIARLTGITPPAAHTALKDLYNQDVLKRDIIGRQHLYKLNTNNRVVKNILIPAFEKELSTRKEIIEFLKKQIKNKRLKNKIVSLLLYGSFQAGTMDEGSDIDIAVITKEKKNKKQIEKIFLEKISSQFHEYFGVNLDVYINTKDEFLKRLKKNLPPVSTLMKSYSVIYGKDLIDLE